MTLTVKRPEDVASVQKNARAFAILHQLDPHGKGVDQQALTKYAAFGDESKVKELAGKSEVSFEDFAAAFAKSGLSAASGEKEGNCVGYAAQDSSSGLKSWRFNRRELRPDDVQLTITYAGLCHSDVHQIKDEWGGSTYPMCPGHEMIGVVTGIGKDVKKFKVGDFAAVGNMVDSCGDCARCKDDEEQYCAKGWTPTYNGKMPDGEVTQGGYSTHIVTQEKFVFSVAPSLHVPGAAPLLCAGITVYSPMRFYGADKKGMKIGVEGLGGLGHMAVKFGKAFGCHVTVLSRSHKKEDMAIKELGADDFIATGNEDEVKAAAESLDAIIDTVAFNHDINSLLGLLKVDGKLICVGIPSEPYALAAAGFVMRRRMIGGSLIGGIKETQEMLDFCSENNIFCDVEVVSADYTNEAFKRMEAGDVHFRFVIDNLKSMIPDEQ